MMGCSSCRLEPWRLMWAVVGIVAFLLDVSTDLWAAVRYLQAGEYIWFGTVLVLLILASVLIQIFSWCWYESDKELKESPELKIIHWLLTSEGRCWLGLLHVLQLGYFVRYLAMLEFGFRACFQTRERKQLDKGYAVYYSHDLSMLRLFETFLESVPQVILTVCIILHTSKIEPSQGLGKRNLFLAITWSVFDYHQSLRSYLEDSHELGYLASAVYFLWNLLLLTPRILCIAIFTSQFHYFTLIHVVAVWIPMFIWATQQKTDFMEKPASEWFYRAVVAIIWYFSWFNTAKGKTLTRVIIYYFFVTIDCTILLAWIWWYKGPKAINRYLVLIILGIAVSYMLGLVLRCVYYQWFHPKVRMQKPATSDEVDSEKQSLNSMYRCAQMESGPHAPTNKRMQALARNFFNGNNDNRVCRNGLNMDMRTTSL
ncbi:XK-related protein 8 [Latimeria chalumnae]|uniref:XK-related protein 8 n=1 Tax=Latimeria chalumnae TaxID=7897 RepID=UPI00313E689D